MVQKKTNQINFKFYSSKGFFSPIFSLTQLYSFEHFSEIRQRITYILIFLVLNTFLIFSKIKLVVKTLEKPVSTIQFFQSSPEEYFLSTFIISISMGFILSIPFIFGQILFFFRPALNFNEKKIINLLIFCSIILFFSGLSFSYFILIPAALNFFIFYSSEVLEPFLSFEEYYNFVASLFISTGLVFQLPIVQIIFSFANIINPTQMLNLWRPMILLSTILGAILTPSADPITQLLLSLALFLLYFLGTTTSIYLTKSIKQS
uniref:Sec-independent protein translocase component TatC n=1 Tax=Dictyopteris divaricata TaxID=156996 RepID=A0A2I4Q2T2_9PHAE|nr:Sec-independent protein translocase component TatC [Dictyopteris divaricata]YP_010205304.1 Sec-independent protein translocase component TatC [Grateloupia livida]AQZ25016.1 Sec-independent protein translocase component TatC [Dictyopteris divaricata]UAV85873.1 Sec-independent protein translocase component TatC [Grateloupia livida]